MKLDKLITLSEYIEFADKNSGGLPATFRAHVKYYNSLLLKPLHLGLFVPCVNGVPLKQPSSDLGEFNERIQYRSSKRDVIFQGWEVMPPKEMSFNREIRIHNGDWCTELSEDKKKIKVLTKCKRSIYYTGPISYPVNLSDLAEATKLNPIELK